MITILSFFKNILRNFIINKTNKTLILGRMVEIKNCKLGVNIHLGDKTRIINTTIDDNSYTSFSCFIHNAVIGKFCSIGPNVLIGLGEHPTSKFVSTSPCFFSPSSPNKSFVDKLYFGDFKKTVIENDVWIGANVFIKDGIRIHNGAIIAAGSVVVKDVPAYTIVAGVPAKKIRNRFTDEQIEFLINFKWWDKDKDWIRNNAMLFHDIEKFISL